MTLQERALGANYHSEIRKRRRAAGKKKKVNKQQAGREGLESVVSQKPGEESI